MADKTGSSGAAGRAPAAGQVDSVRNVVLVGHSGAGKTTLVEALLVHTGGIQRAGRVEDGTTVSDFDEVEVRQQRSVNLTLAPVLHSGVKVLIGLLSERFYDYSSGTRTDREPDPEHADRLAEFRSALIESIIQESEDESLMDRYLADEHIDVKVLIEDLEKAVAQGRFYPVLPAASPHGVGLAEVLEVMTEAFPAPEEHPLPAVSTLDGKPVGGIRCDPKGPLLAEVIKTTSDSYVGRISLVRVFSGTLRPDAFVHVSGHGRADRGHADHDQDERVGALTSPLGKQQRTVAQCAAGDICAVAKLTTAETGDSLSDKERPLLMESWAMPEPLLPVAITAKSKADEDKMSQAIARLVAEDPTLRLENNAETRQLVMWCMGEAHADLLRVRVHRQDRRRRGAEAVHPVGREGRPRPDGSRRAGRLPDGGHPGHPVRRQGARGGLLGHGVPEGWPGGAAGRGGEGAGPAARAGRRGVGAGRR